MLEAERLQKSPCFGAFLNGTKTSQKREAKKALLSHPEMSRMWMFVAQEMTPLSASMADKGKQRRELGRCFVKDFWLTGLALRPLPAGSSP